jgi:hypothetical protein
MRGKEGRRRVGERKEICSGFNSGVVSEGERWSGFNSKVAFEGEIWSMFSPGAVRGGFIIALLVQKQICISEHLLSVRHSSFLQNSFSHLSSFLRCAMRYYSEKFFGFTSVRLLVVISSLGLPLSGA